MRKDSLWAFQSFLTAVLTNNKSWNPTWPVKKAARRGRPCLSTTLATNIKVHTWNKYVILPLYYYNIKKNVL